MVWVKASWFRKSSSASSTQGYLYTWSPKTSGCRMRNPVSIGVLDHVSLLMICHYWWRVVIDDLSLLMTCRYGWRVVIDDLSLLMTCRYGWFVVIDDLSLLMTCRYWWRGTSWVPIGLKLVFFFTYNRIGKGGGARHLVVLTLYGDRYFFSASVERIHEG